MYSYVKLCGFDTKKKLICPSSSMYLCVVVSKLIWVVNIIDPDMLEVGNGGMSLEEYRSHFSIWALMKVSCPSWPFLCPSLYHL